MKFRISAVCRLPNKSSSLTGFHDSRNWQLKCLIISNTLKKKERKTIILKSNYELWDSIFLFLSRGNENQYTNLMELLSIRVTNSSILKF